MKMKIRKTEQGVHFFSRDSGTNLLLDEIEMPQGELASAPANVSVAVTNRCNRSCPHCFAEKGGEDLDYEGLCGLGLAAASLCCIHALSIFADIWRKTRKWPAP